MVYYVITHNGGDPVLIRDHVIAEEYAEDLKKRWPMAKVDIESVEEGRPHGHKLVWAAYCCFDPDTKKFSTFQRQWVWEADLNSPTYTMTDGRLIYYTATTDEATALKEARRVHG